MMHSCIPDVKLLISDNTESCIPNGKKVSYWIFLNFVKTLFEVNCFEICGICSSRKSRKSKILDQWGIESLPFTCMQSICPSYWGAIRCFGRVIVHMIFVYLPYKPLIVSQKNPSQKGLCIFALNRLRNKGPPYSAVTSRVVALNLLSALPCRAAIRTPRIKLAKASLLFWVLRPLGLNKGREYHRVVLLAGG